MKYLKILILISFFINSIYLVGQQQPGPDDEPFFVPGSYIIFNEDTLYDFSDIEPILNVTGKPLRIPTINDEPPVTNAVAWIEWWYSKGATITCMLGPSTTVYEMGTTNIISIYGITTENGNSISHGQVHSSGSTAILQPEFGTSNSYNYLISFTPRGVSGDYNGVVYTFYATQDYTGNENGTCTSTSVSIYGVFPVFYGISPNDYSGSLTGITEDTDIIKLIEREGDKTLDFSGSGYIYFLLPTQWTDENLSSVIDHNNFENLNVFTRIGYLSLTVPAGLPEQVGYTHSYVVYKYNNFLVSIDWNNWQFKR